MTIIQSVALHRPGVANDIYFRLVTVVVIDINHITAIAEKNWDENIKVRLVRSPKVSACIALTKRLSVGDFDVFVPVLLRDGRHTVYGSQI